MPRDESVVDSSGSRLLELLTADDVAALLKVSKSWVYEHTRSRRTPQTQRLPHVKIGKYVRFDPQLVRGFIDRHMTRGDLVNARGATMADELQHEESARGKGCSR